MSDAIFANHAHVFPDSVRADATLAVLLQHLDACGIARAVCFAPFAHQYLDGNPNRWLANELKRQDRLIGFGTIDIRRPDRRDQVREARDLGFKGLKLHPNAQEFDVLSPDAMEIYDEAQSQNLFCTFHTGVHRYRLAHYRVVHFDEIVWNFPKLKISLEHVGGYSFFNEALAVIVNNIPFPQSRYDRCHVFAGLTSIFSPDFLRFWYMNPERMMELILQAGAEQCIFGLDFPYNSIELTKLGIQTIRALPISREQQDLILGKNLARELGV